MNVGEQIHKEINKATWEPTAGGVADVAAPGPWDAIHSLVQFEVASLTEEEASFIRQRIMRQSRRCFS